MYVTDQGGNPVRGITQDPDTLVWSEQEVLSSVSNAANSGYGASYLHRNAIYWKTAANAGSPTGTRSIVWDPSTSSAALGGVDLGLDTFNQNQVIWNDRAFTLGFDASGGNTWIILVEQTGGTFSTHDAVSGPFLDTWQSSDGVHGLFVGADNALWCLAAKKDGTAEIKIIRWTLDEDGATILRNCPTASTDDDPGEVGLPASLRSGIVIGWHSYSWLDTEKALESLTRRLWTFNGLGISGVEWEIEDPWEALVAGATNVIWRGTAGNANDVEFPSNPGLIVGDWIRHRKKNQCFRVAGVTGANNQLIQISNESGGDISAPPNGSSATDKMGSLLTIMGSPSTLIGYSFPNDQRGGGGYIYSEGDLHVEWRNNEKVLGGERITFKCFSDDGTKLVTLKGQYVAKDNTIQRCTFKSPSAGSLAGDSLSVTSIPADNSTEHTVISLSPPVNIQDLILDVQET